MGKEKQTNGVEIATLILTVLIACGGIWSYFDVGRPLAKAQSESQTRQNEIEKQQVLSTSGKILTSPSGPNGLFTLGLNSRPMRVVMELRNTGSAPITFGRIDYKIYKRRIPDQWIGLNGPGAPHLPEAAPPAPPKDNGLGGDVDAGPPPKRTSLVRVLDAYASSDGEWELIEDWSYSPKEYSGGIILRGQARAVMFDCLVSDGDSPEVVKVVATVHPAEDAAQQQTWHKQVWVGWAGTGPIRDLFAIDNYPFDPAGTPPVGAPPSHTDFGVP